MYIFSANFQHGNSKVQYVHTRVKGDGTNIWQDLKDAAS